MVALRKKRNKIIHLRRILIGILAVCVVVVFILNDRISISRYQVNGFLGKIILLSDIHSYEDSEKIVEIVAGEFPDLIMVVGDIINAYDSEYSGAIDLLSSFTKIAPTYVALGNQEIECEKRTDNDISAVLARSDVKVLHFAYDECVIHGIELRIGGIYGYCVPEQYQINNEDEIAFLREFENTESYKILLDHIPYSWSHYGITADYDIDLVCSGHTHGGQVLLPFVGGLYEQEFGWFPGKMHGKFESNGTTVIVSKGISSAKERIPRINNPGEIVVIEGLTYE